MSSATSGLVRATITYSQVTFLPDYNSKKVSPEFVDALLRGYEIPFTILEYGHDGVARGKCMIDISPEHAERIIQIPGVLGVSYSKGELQFLIEKKVSATEPVNFSGRPRTLEDCAGDAIVSILLKTKTSDYVPSGITARRRYDEHTFASRVVSKNIPELIKNADVHQFHLGYVIEPAKNDLLMPVSALSNLDRKWESLITGKDTLITGKDIYATIAKTDPTFEIQHHARELLIDPSTECFELGDLMSGFNRLKKRVPKSNFFNRRVATLT
ncbi:MAG: hypothetical protein Q7K43_01545 [Candidatus Woesearchaeota archaeon]|nr:hypothetical protein [Candidatus Woesearchaeota archaeon]